MTLRFFPVMYPAAAHFVDTTIIRSLKKYTVGRSCRCLSIVEIIFQEYIMGTEGILIHSFFFYNTVVEIPVKTYDFRIRRRNFIN